MDDFTALLAGYLAGSAMRFFVDSTVEVVVDNEGNYTGHFTVTNNTTGQQVVVHLEPVKW
jgi:hypothetical protein